MASKYISVDVDVSIDDFDDDAIVDAIFERELQAAILKRLAGNKNGEEPESGESCDPSVLIHDVLSHLLGRRLERAKTAMKRYLEAILPPGIIEAYEAVLAGRVDDAICLLDRVIEPSPAVSAKELPKKEAA